VRDVDQLAALDLIVPRAEPALEHRRIEPWVSGERAPDEIEDVVQEIAFVARVLALRREHDPVRAARRDQRGSRRGQRLQQATARLWVPGARPARVGGHALVVERDHGVVQRVLRQEDALAVEVDRKPVRSAGRQHLPDARQGRLQIGQVQHRVGEHEIERAAALGRRQELEQVRTHELDVEPGVTLLHGYRVHAGFGDRSPRLQVSARGGQAVGVAIDERVLRATEHAPVCQA